MHKGSGENSSSNSGQATKAPPPELTENRNFFQVQKSSFSLVVRPLPPFPKKNIRFIQYIVKM